VTAPTAALVAANDDCCGGWSITVDGVDLVAPGPMLAVQGKLAKVPIITGSVREDIASPYVHPLPCLVGEMSRHWRSQVAVLHC